MNRISCIFKSFLWAILLNQTLCYGADTSRITIQSEPEVEVFLDGKFIGKTSSENGEFVFRDVSLGSHTFQLLKKENAPRNQSTRKITIAEEVSLELVEIPAGDFQMGSDDRSNERPLHKVHLERFMMGKYEVTKRQYNAVVGRNDSHPQDLDKPVEMVPWDEAAEFCVKLSRLTGLRFRLPTEAEWEYACRAGTETRYYFGDSDELLADYGWFNNNSANQTHSVGLKKPNPWGLYDMYGNVWEWCGDYYGENYYEVSSEINPTGPPYGSSKVSRGGDWYDASDICRSSYRRKNPSGYNGNLQGFRVVLEY